MPTDFREKVAHVTELIDGFALGHWTHENSRTGCSVILPPQNTVAAAEVRGGGPGTRESELLQPSAAVDGVDAVLLTGGSAHGLAAADGVVDWLLERDRGYETAGGLVPLVASAVLYDLVLGSPDARPGPEGGYSACGAATSAIVRGSVGVGAGCTVGKMLGEDGWCRGGLGFAETQLDSGARVQAIAAVNAFGDVLGETGEIIAGVRKNGSFAGTVKMLQSGAPFRRAIREATTLVCVLTDAALDKRDAWLVARAANAGTARAVAPVATAVDGDMAFCLASGRQEAEPFVVEAVAADMVSQAIRDGVRQASSLPGCPVGALL
jgi:L-aminopeptidase/D-esterase-like protein